MPRALAAAGFRVLSPDLRGHGNSGKPMELEAWKGTGTKDDPYDAR